MENFLPRSGAEIIDFVLNGPAGRGADPQDPDKRRATPDEVELYIYGPVVIGLTQMANKAIRGIQEPQGPNWPHLMDVATAEQDEEIDRFRENWYSDLLDGTNELPGG
jgi:hypothetical protein